MLWRDTQLRVAILGVDAPAFIVLLLPAIWLHEWTLGVAFGVIAIFGIIRFFGVTPQSVMRGVRVRLIGTVRPTLMRTNLWRARMRRL